MAQEILVEVAVDMDLVAQLWAQYWDEHHEDLGAQDLASEARALPAGYEAPDGALLIAHMGKEAVGTIGLQRYDAQTADMRRLYVPQEFRGEGIGEALVKAVIAKAQAMGFKRMILDVSESQVAALHLYENAGFTEASGYEFSPLKRAVYLQRDL